MKQLDEQLNLPRLMGDKERRLVYECSASLLHLNVDSVKPRSPEELGMWNQSYKSIKMIFLYLGLKCSSSLQRSDSPEKLVSMPWSIYMSTMLAQ